MADRFFPVTLLGGRLHLRNIPQWSKWDSSKLERWTKAEIYPFPGDRIIKTKEELEVAMREPKGVTPVRTLWVHDDLEDEVRRLWEKE